jgi:hypothetical protein
MTRVKDRGTLIYLFVPSGFRRMDMDPGRGMKPGPLGNICFQVVSPCLRLDCSSTPFQSVLDFDVSGSGVTCRKSMCQSCVIQENPFSHSSPHAWNVAIGPADLDTVS